MPDRLAGMQVRSSSAENNRFSRIEQTAADLTARGAFAGIEWLVMRGGTEWARGQAGMADPLAQKPMPEKPVYRIYSMTKPVIAAMAMILLEQGKLRLFDPVSAYLPDFANMQILDQDGKLTDAGRPMIVEHLFSHRAGFSLGFLPDPVARLYVSHDIDTPEKTLAQFVAEAAELPLAFEPGTQWRYSISIDVLARIVEIAADAQLPNVLREYIFDPLGMNETGYIVPDSQKERIMPCFGAADLDRIFEFAPGSQQLTPSPVENRNPHDNPGFWRGGYGLFSTLDDYARMAKFLASGVSEEGERLLSRKSVEMLWTNRIPPSQLPLVLGPLLLPGYGWGLGGRVMLDIGQALSPTGNGECGWAGAASTYFWIDPAEKLIGLIMSQYLGSKIPLGDEMRRAVYQALDD